MTMRITSWDGASELRRVAASSNYQDGYKLRAKIEALTANTKERARRYLDYNRAASGSVTRLPDGNTCEE